MLAYEGFGGVTVEGASLNGYTPGTASTGLTGAWSVTGGSEKTTFRENPEYKAIGGGHAPEATGAAQHWWEHNNEWNTNLASVNLGSPVDLSVDGTHYMSFFSMTRHDDYTAEIGLGNASDEILWGQGYNRGLTAFYGPLNTLANDANQNGSGLPPLADSGGYDTVFYVAQLVKSDSGASNTLTVNIKAYNLSTSNEIDQSPPVAWSRSVTLTGVVGSYSTLRARLDGAGNNYPSMDELRLGDTWGDVTGILSSPYAAWAATHVGGQLANLDYDSDGVTNGVEFFMNSTRGPTQNPSLISNSISWPNGGNIPSSAYGSQFIVQVSGDLTTWVPVSPSDPLLVNTASGVTYTLPTGSGKLFVRLVVTAQ